MNNTDLRVDQSTKWFVILVKNGNTIKALSRKDSKYFHCTVNPSDMRRLSSEESALRFWEKYKGYYENYGLEFLGIRELEVNYKLNIKEKTNEQ